MSCITMTGAWPRRVHTACTALACFAVGTVSAARAQPTTSSALTCEGTARNVPVTGPSARTHLTTGLGFLQGGIFDDLRSLGVRGFEVELRHYRPRTWVLGARVYFGDGGFTPVEGDPPTGSISTGPTFALWVAPLLGIHLTTETESDNSGYAGSSLRGVLHCDYRYLRRRYASHVLGVEPVLWVVQDVGGGGHAVWEYDVYGDGHEARYHQTGQTGTEEDYRFRTAVKVGFITQLGVGGIWEGGFGWGPVDLHAGLGAYVDGDGASLFLSAGVGVFWL